MHYKLYLRLLDSGDEAFFGPGPARLFRQVQAHASLHRAAAAMEMSYSKAWRMVRNVELALGEPMLIRTRGGNDGGGSTLTAAAEALLAAYEAFETDVRAEVDRLFAAHFPQ